MKPFLILAVLLVSTCSASLYAGGAISSQYQQLDPHSHTYSYGYADPNSQKHETRSHDGVTRGSYSYVDGNGHVQSVAYTADPHHGFNAVGTNLPQGPVPVAHYAASHAYAPYHQSAAVHHVALTHAGVPVDTPEVQHARAAHYAAYAAAAAAAAHAPEGHHHLYKRSLYAGPWAYGHVAALTHVPLTHEGVPVDTPDVQAARAEHLAAHAKALGHHYPGSGAPADTPEVAHAKASHFAAHAAARSGHPGLPISHGYHVPVIHNGVPVDTPEVQHAKAAHYAALAEASSRAGHGGSGLDDGGWDGGSHYATSGYAHTGPIHIPVIHNGVPVDTPEVQHARAAHLNALAAASHGGGHVASSSYHDDGAYYGHHY